MEENNAVAQETPVVQETPAQDAPTTPAVTYESADPWNQLGDIASSTDTLLLIGGPTALFLIIGLIYFVLISIKRSKEKKQLDEVMALADKPSELLPLDDKLAGDEPSDATAAAEAKIADFAAERGKTGPADVKEVLSLDDRGWLSKLRDGLSKTREQLLGSLNFLRGTKKIDEATLEKLHAALYKSDIGVEATDYLIEQVRERVGKNEETSWDEFQVVLKDEITKILTVSDQPINEPEDGPFVILIVGVNGVGKTTTIGKLAAHYLAEERTVLLAAADTFRAAAIDQLKVWGERLGVEVIAHQQGGDPAAVAFDAVKAAKARKADVLLVDTAGRLHNKQELMDELAKINRVLGKDLAGAPHEVWLVIDATTGQNALQQAKAFKDCVEVSGVVVTKLDGTAKGGVLVGVCAQQKLPIRYVGVGEKAADLRRFVAQDFVESMF